MAYWLTPTQAYHDARTAEFKIKGRWLIGDPRVLVDSDLEWVKARVNVGDSDGGWQTVR